MKPVILFRAGLAEEEDMRVCKEYFTVITQRSHIQKDWLVIPRYSALPWYKEFEADVEYAGAKLINTYRQHSYVADLQNWYYDLDDLTPRTWFYLDQLPTEGPFVLNWNTHMFAKNKYEAMEVYARLCEDSHIGAQHIYAREYIPLRHFTKAIQGLPITEEYRFFVMNGKVLSGAFYWSEHTEYIKEEMGYTPDPNLVPGDFLKKVIDNIAPKIPFFVVDIARTTEGKWIVIELNDGQMAGLSDNNPEILYSNMKKLLDGKSVTNYA
jgi:hypothetical protein